MLTERFLLGRGRFRLSEPEKVALEGAIASVETLEAHRMIVRRGDPVFQSTFLIEGLVSRYLDDREGQRQIVAIHVPGDFVDLHAFPMWRLDHDLATLTPVKIATFEHRTLLTLTETHPHLTRKLWFSTLLDAAMHREWIFRLGRLDAEGRVAHLLSELHTRMGFVGLAEEGRFALPITQGELAEACGVTSVHVNRVLRSLRERGLVTFRGGMVEIGDAAGLARAGEFNPDYLYGDDGWAAVGARSDAA